MTHTEIKRIKAIVAVEDVSIPEIRKQAVDVLGYSKPKAEEILPDKLAATLATLEIEILDWRDVFRYQLEAKQALEREQLVELIGQASRPRWRNNPDWRETEISDYRGYIPDHVLQKAVEIKRALPEVHIYVEHLEADRDPFLFVADGGKYDFASHVYYVEVWNEPGFERA